MTDIDIRVALDIGNSKVSALVAKIDGFRRLDVLGFADSPNDEASGPGYENPSLASEAVRNALDEVARQSRLDVKRAYVSIGGQHIEAFNKRDVLTRSSAVRVITDADISAAARVAGNVDLPKDRELLHVIPRNYEVDGSILRNPVGMHAGNLPVETHIITGSVQEIQLLKNITRDAGVVPDFMIAKPVASAEAILAPEEREEGTALLDLGSSYTGIAIFYDGSIIHSSSLPVGGFHMTNDLSIAFAIAFEEADEIKLKYGSCNVDRRSQSQEIEVHPARMDEPLVINAAEVATLLKDRMDELIQMSTIKTNVPELAQVPVDNFVLTGGTSKLPGCDTLFRYKLQKRVRLGKLTQSANVDEKLNDPRYATVYGMIQWAMKNLPPARHTVTYSPAPSVVGISEGRDTNPGKSVSDKRGFFSAFFRRKD